jgi:hypothetical protein
MLEKVRFNQTSAMQVQIERRLIFRSIIGGLIFIEEAKW